MSNLRVGTRYCFAIINITSYTFISMNTTCLASLCLILLHWNNEPTRSHLKNVIILLGRHTVSINRSSSNQNFATIILWPTLSSMAQIEYENGLLFRGFNYYIHSLKGKLIWQFLLLSFVAILILGGARIWIKLVLQHRQVLTPCHKSHYLCSKVNKDFCIGAFNEDILYFYEGSNREDLQQLIVNAVQKRESQ